MHGEVLHNIFIIIVYGSELHGFLCAPLHATGARFILSSLVVSIYLAKQSEPLLVICRTSTSSMILPVQIQAIKSMSPQEFHGRLDECLTFVCSGHHGGEPADDGKPVTSSLK